MVINFVKTETKTKETDIRAGKDGLAVETMIGDLIGLIKVKEPSLKPNCENMIVRKAKNSDIDRRLYLAAM